MSMVITSKSLLEEKHNLTKKYPGLHHLLEAQKAVLDDIEKNVPQEQDDVCIEAYERNYFNVSTPVEAIENMISLYGKEALQEALEKLNNIYINK